MGATGNGLDPDALLSDADDDDDAGAAEFTVATLELTDT
jgi:hypothetical protein